MTHLSAELPPDAMAVIGAIPDSAPAIANTAHIRFMSSPCS